MRILCLDVGSKTIGVAVSDELGITAQGIKIIKRKGIDDDIGELSAIISKFRIEKIVVGLPKKMDGTLGKQAELVLEWVQWLQRKISLPVETWDERFSTVEASKTLIRADLSRKKRKGVVDKLAAVLILQGYLQQIRNQENDLLPSA